MKTLFDYLWTHGWHPFFGGKFREAALRKAHESFDVPLDRAVRFEISNVAEWMQHSRPVPPTHADGTEGDYSEMIVAAPPFPRMWMEYRCQSMLHPDLQESPEDAKPTTQTIGWLLEFEDLDIHTEYRELIRENYKSTEAADDIERWHRVVDGARWLCVATDWSRVEKFRGGEEVEAVLGPSFSCLLIVDGNGTVTYTLPMPQRASDAGRDQFMAGDAEDVRSKLLPCLFALTFMNCRGVIHREAKPKRQESRQHERQTGRPLTEYRVIQIDPDEPVVVTDHDGARSSGGMPLHIVRGHFRVYTEDAPLFGHTVGPVWVPAHKKGSAKAGVRVHDYEVHGHKDDNRKD